MAKSRASTSTSRDKLRASDSSIRKAWMPTSVAFCLGVSATRNPSPNNTQQIIMQADYEPDRHLKSFEEVATAALDHWLGAAGPLPPQYKTILKYLPPTQVIHHSHPQFTST